MTITDHTPIEPPVNLPGGNRPQPPKPSSLFCTADHRAWLLSVPCVNGGRQWVWDGQPFEDGASPMYVSVDVPALHMPLADLANHPGFHSLSASHAGDDYIRPAVTS